jgi:hypothetical protein
LGRIHMKTESKRERPMKKTDLGASAAGHRERAA